MKASTTISSLIHWDEESHWWPVPQNLWRPGGRSETQTTVATGPLLWYLCCQGWGLYTQQDIDTGDSLQPLPLFPHTRKDSCGWAEDTGGRHHWPTSPWTVPVVLVKKNGTWCFCADYRLLSNITHKDSYPMPSVNDTLYIAGSCWFSSLDLRNGYWQVELLTEARPKTASIFSIVIR